MGHATLTRAITLTAGSAALLALAGTGSAMAQEEGGFPGEFSGAAAFTTDYNFRGISQTRRDPAAQAEIDYAADLTDGVGFYLGAWGSNVDFIDSITAGETVEIDYYAGLEGEIDIVSWTFGGIYYSYPGSDDDADFDYWEINGSLGTSYGPIDLSVGLNYSPEFFGDTGDAFYISGDAAVDLPDMGWFSPSLNLHVGRNEFEKSSGLVDYTDWSIGLAVGLANTPITLDVSYIDTDLSDIECGGGVCDAKAVFTISADF